MLEQGFFLFVLAGTSYAAYLDLKTSEVPDWISIAVAAASLAYYSHVSLVAGSFEPLLASVVAGTGLFLMGWAMYMAGMWGGADAFILGAVGYAFPYLPSTLTPHYAAPWPAPVSLVLTVFLTGAVYSLFYALYLALRSEDFVGKLAGEIEARRRSYSVIVLLYTLVAGLTTAAVYTAFNPPLITVARNFAASLVLLALLLGLTAFLRTVESRVMEMEITVGELEAGDVLAEEIELEEVREDAVEDFTDRVSEAVRSAIPFTLPWTGSSGGRIAGLTPGQVEEIRGKRESVKVRTGVRFIPAFPASVLVLLLFGDPIYFVLLQAL